MCWPTTRRNHASVHHVCVAKDTHAHSIIIARTSVVAHASLNIGKFTQRSYSRILIFKINLFMFQRSTPCPNVKHGEEWGEPANCESGDNCQYCHTRTEQQFHPEIYKSTKCNDVQQAGYCPRSVFCAFAHVERK